MEIGKRILDSVVATWTTYRGTSPLAESKRTSKKKKKETDKLKKLTTVRLIPLISKKNWKKKIRKFIDRFGEILSNFGMNTDSVMSTHYMFSFLKIKIAVKIDLLIIDHFSKMYSELYDYFTKLCSFGWFKRSKSHSLVPPWRQNKFRCSTTIRQIMYEAGVRGGGGGERDEKSVETSTRAG